jgi:integrase
MAKGNKEGHRRFGNIRRLPSGRFQASYLGPDGQRRNAPQTYERKSDADKALSIIEGQIAKGEWTDPDRGKIKLADYAATWIDERPGLRPRSADQYRWLLRKHIAPQLGGVALAKLSTAMIRQWRATLLRNGVSVSVAAKAYRLLRAVLMTAADEDHILPRNPCRIRGAGDEHADERPVLSVTQVFDLAEMVGRRPIGNIRKLPAGGYRLRFRRDDVMRTSPEIYHTREAAESALWKLADDGHVDFDHDRRFRALVLLTTFASLRWGEAIALHRADLDFGARCVRVRATLVERSTGEILLGPPKSKAGRRIVGIPEAIIPALREHLELFASSGSASLVFPGAKGGPLRRSNFNKMTAWPYAVRSIGVAGLHFHDLRHTGNTFAASGGAGVKDLMARMGHDSERAAMIYQHEARGADQTITSAIDAHIAAERDHQDEDDDGQADSLVPAG